MSGGDPLYSLHTLRMRLGKRSSAMLLSKLKLFLSFVAAAPKRSVYVGPLKGVQCYNTLIKYICDTYICLAHPHNQTYTSGCVSQDFSAPHKLFKIIKGVYKT